MKTMRIYPNIPAMIFCLFALLAIAVPKAYSAGGINKDENAIAIKGYDTVAYFTEGRAVKGNGKYSFTWEDAVWHFSTSKNRELFTENPVQYAPQFGGHCANGMSSGVVAGADPEQWTIVDGKLYLKYHRKARDDWRMNKTELIAKAEENWTKLNK